ncbi:uncharacterized protein B0I36DRAFT_380164 [Microdochium trichocladiopsis]|uniref:BTB domain-containing protein n=1 Tax=Microdochium trichocladiopsis TaxID=1682393 RepID=A0A9P8YJ06_9PEZI|nr:uncharacterized protein B0I36DRAFT_380164 [Microdochium trichocladiopsis]KAH7041391.1 hypothetical protein B0I36DRAFT_380164 [Microdochium trichocladiopsis]
MPPLLALATRFPDRRPNQLLHGKSEYATTTAVTFKDCKSLQVHSFIAAKLEPVIEKNSNDGFGDRAPASTTHVHGLTRQPARLSISSHAGHVLVHYLYTGEIQILPALAEQIRGRPHPESPPTAISEELSDKLLLTLTEDVMLSPSDQMFLHAVLKAERSNSIENNDESKDDNDAASDNEKLDQIRDTLFPLRDALCSGVLQARIDSTWMTFCSDRNWMLASYSLLDGETEPGATLL